MLNNHNIRVYLVNIDDIAQKKEMTRRDGRLCL